MSRLHKTLAAGLIALLASLAAAVPAAAAITFVSGQIVDGGAVNDLTLTFASNWTTGNVVVVIASFPQEAQTIDLTDITETETVLHGPQDHSTATNLRAYIFCFVVDASADNALIATSSGSGVVTAIGFELAGATCTEDGTSSGNDDDASGYELTTDITTSVCGSMVIGNIRSSTASDYTSTGTGFTALGDAGDGSNGDYNGGDGLGNSLAAYNITTSTGTYDPTFSSVAGETSVIMGAAIQPATACGGAAGAPQELLLLGVGR